MKACVIAAPMTGSGKTTVTIGLLAALRARKIAVQSFKVGPDFIDPGLHELATGVPAHNLDGWMLSEATNRMLFEDAARKKDVAIVEGVMGLFDGFDGKSDSGSTSEMARWLDLPIVFVVDAGAMARSAAAIVHGFRTFDSRLKFAGVIFNRVAGPKHFQIFADSVTDIPILGWLPSNPEIAVPERHLGLLTGKESEARDRIARLGDFVTGHLDIDRFLAAIPEIGEPAAATVPPAVVNGKRIRVGIAGDAAFQFYYHANRTALEQAGATLIDFSILAAAEIPDVDVLYIGGGYPELYRDRLEANRAMRESVRKYVESGGRVYAECGGLMYLAHCGVLPTEIEVTDRPVNFGYCDVTTTQPSILGPAGTRVRGHQFHYSKCTRESTNPVYSIRQSGREYGEGFLLPNGIASWVHLHFLSNPAIAACVLKS